MEEDSAMSVPYEEFLICFCGKIPSGSVEWYFIDVSVEEACLSEKTESSTRKLNPFSVAKHLSSYATLNGLIFSLGGQRPSGVSGETLLNDVWLLDFKSLLEYLKPGSILPQPDSGKAHIGEDLKPGSILPQPSSGKAHIGEDLKPGSILPQSSWRKLHIGEDWQADSDKARARVRARARQLALIRAQARARARALCAVGPPGDQNIKFLRGGEDWAFKEPKLETLPPVEDMGLDLGEYLEEEYRKICKNAFKSWVRGLPMNFARYKPHTMVVDHKLYVLGGFKPNQNQANGWIEVFDPVVGKWESLPSPPDQIHSSIMISGLLKSKKEIIIARQRWDCHPLLFYSYNITTRCWNELSLHSDSKASVHPNVERDVILPPNIGRAVTVDNTLYWIYTEEDNHECTILAYDLDRNMWFEDHLNTYKIFESEREYFSSIYSRGPGFLHLVDQKFCLLLQSSVTKHSQPSIEYLYCVILNISPIYEHEHEDWGKFERKIVSVRKYSMDLYIDFLDCMLLSNEASVMIKV